MVRERILAGVRVESLSESLAKLAGEALAAIKGAMPIDAIVMGLCGSAWRRRLHLRGFGLAKLAGYFRAVRVLSTVDC